MATIQNLVTEFVVAVVGSHQSIGTGDKAGAQKYSKREVDLAQKILNFGTEGTEKLEELLQHHILAVKVAAAALLLRRRTEKALSVLREAAKGEGLVSWEAGSVIRHWEEGTWNIDFEGEPERLDYS